MLGAGGAAIGALGVGNGDAEAGAGGKEAEVGGVVGSGCMGVGTVVGEGVTEGGTEGLGGVTGGSSFGGSTVGKFVGIAIVASASGGDSGVTTPGVGRVDEVGAGGLDGAGEVLGASTGVSDGGSKAWSSASI